MKLLIKQFSTVVGRYRKTRAVFDWSWDNTNKHNGRRKTFLAVLQGKSTKCRAGDVGMKICEIAGREERVGIIQEGKSVTNSNNQLLVLS